MIKTAPRGAEMSDTAQRSQGSMALDARVQHFLNESRGKWRDWNVPYGDGRVLYNLITEGGYRRAMEIGTSTGHSTLWIAWALSRTGGNLITIEIDKSRYETALRNLKRVGLERWVDARLDDAHRLVKELKGPFDFVFSDADKEWYTRYFKEVDPKLAVGGCFTAHNVADPFPGIEDFLACVRPLPNYRTTINRTSRSGISISYKVSG
jgi:predicted O-methyltransferase YrrM